MDDFRRPYSVFWPLLLIAAGVFLLLNALGFIQGDFWGLFVRLWPLLFIAGGLDSLYRRESFVGPILFIGLGTAILLANLGYLEFVSWTVFLRLWPVLLIAFGLDILIGHRSMWSAVVGVALGVLLVVGVFWYASTLPETRAGVQTESIVQELQGAEEAAVDLNQIFGEMNIRGGAAEGNLLDGEMQLGRNQTYTQDYRISNGRGIFSLDSTTADAYVPFLNPAVSLVSQFNLSDAVPLVLDTDMVVGLINVDLRDLNIDRFDLTVVIGQNTIVLGLDEELEGRASAVIGQVLVRVPRDAAVRIRLDTALTGTSFPREYERDDDVVYSPAAGRDGPAIELEINIPLGSIRIEYID
jgi:hypothetical protein